MANLRNLGVIAALAISPLPAVAHHGVSGQFDTSETFVVTGKITRISLVNPHAYVYFDVEGDTGEAMNMRCELLSGSSLKRRGWSEDMFEIDSVITVNGSPDRDDTTTCYMNQITFENGVTATRESSFADDGSVAAQERQTEREDGTPNIDGNWAMVRPEGEARDPEGRPTAPSLTEAGAAAVADASPDENPRFNCQATNIVMDWWFNQMVNSITQSDTEITLTYGFMDMERTIHLDGSEMPEDVAPSRVGYSVGEWDGNTLVVTTVGFDEGWIMAPLGGRAGVLSDGDDAPEGEAERPERPEGERGGPQPVKNSTELTVTERFVLNDDGSVLTREYVLVDPLYLSEPIEGADEVTLTSDAYEPFACDDLTNERTE